MSNLYQQINPQNQTNPQLQNNQGIQQIINMAKSGGNPMQMIQSIAGQNPQMQNMMNILNSGKMSPKQLFMNMANQRGINPNEIINMLK